MGTLRGNPFFFFPFVFFFRDRVSLCSPGCPGTHFVDQAGLKLRNPPASAPQVLGLKACATTARPEILFFKKYLSSVFYIFFWTTACYLNNFKEKGYASERKLVTNACGFQVEVVANGKYWPSFTEAQNCLSCAPVTSSLLYFPCTSVGKSFLLSPEIPVLVLFIDHRVCREPGKETETMRIIRGTRMQK